MATGTRRRPRVLCLALALSAAGCGRAPGSDGYVPGLGEIMTLVQMRHAKLWFAGQAGNWPLARYELDELAEGFRDAAGYHPTHKDSPVAIADAIPQMTDAPMAALRKAVAAEDRRAFGEAFAALTKACNACHEATNFACNVVVRPAANPFPNQRFAPPVRQAPKIR